MAEFRYLPMTEDDRQAMLKTIGADSEEALFSDVPENIRFKGELKTEKALSEPELVRLFSELAKKNVSTIDLPSFLGAGVYDHYIPSVVDSVISRGEFYTAYTPYQAEVSQGELQAIFEFQTLICELTGMSVANSSMYDGSTALAEAALLSSGATRKTKVIVSEAVHPEYRQVLDTYAHGRRLHVVTVPVKQGTTDLEALGRAIDGETACVIVQYPNFFGRIEPLKEIESLTHAAGKTHLIVSSNPLALGLLTPPGSFHADIVVGDCQPLGLSESFGGPHCGYFAVTEKLMRKVPGRLVGETVDEEGRRGYVLTLQAREQHIRRDKATSNICSNQALNALASSVAMAAFGKKGIRELAEQNVQKAHYAADLFQNLGIRVETSGSFFNEFVIDCGRPVHEVNDKLLEKGFIGGYDLGLQSDARKNKMLVAVTEMRTKKEIDKFAEILEGIIHG
ncbi:MULTISPECIES: aminomethyl-transferring glycine dehydrogenase subunit GcvPA [unclassified Sporolactobacillus]|uniref:aminomethyl-transferring glycine dehydrogenase subunit GcvPA n=1 Tax=unclassified Sporolactobacillus TaxID=2628533 RepID=UPI0023677670|nr:aminomethyl-transferring glycine dehydrogenase subunit GcvPA [Sporolactobacillus sp. CQH2019]MDD9149281.1 aminomethyl-transferring glycine dehydrogenase subunit GcvPA [Sporolactobacillus sp. CQH2019]